MAEENDNPCVGWWLIVSAAPRRCPCQVAGTASRRRPETIEGLARAVMRLTPKLPQRVRSGRTGPAPADRARRTRSALATPRRSGCTTGPVMLERPSPTLSSFRRLTTATTVRASTPDGDWPRSRLRPRADTSRRGHRTSWPSRRGAPPRITCGGVRGRAHPQLAGRRRSTRAPRHLRPALSIRQASCLTHHRDENRPPQSTGDPTAGQEWSLDRSPAAATTSDTIAVPAPRPQGQLAQDDRGHGPMRGPRTLHAAAGPSRASAHFQERQEEYPSAPAGARDAHRSISA